MSEEPEPLEDLAAGMLNGAMISLLGALLPGALAWQLVTQWATWTADLRSVLVWDSLTGLGLLLVSFQILRVGLRLLWRNATALRRRRRASPIV
jgi:membrane protein DedA with SNARE-associated domain